MCKGACVSVCASDYYFYMINDCACVINDQVELKVRVYSLIFMHACSADSFTLMMLPVR